MSSNKRNDMKTQLAKLDKTIASFELVCSKYPEVETYKILLGCLKFRRANLVTTIGKK